MARHLIALVFVVLGLAMAVELALAEPVPPAPLGDDPVWLDDQPPPPPRKLRKIFKPRQQQVQPLEEMQPPQHRSFFERLFGVRPLTDSPPSGPDGLEPFNRKRPPAPGPNDIAQPAIPAAPPVEIQAKDPKARKILVIGDFVAGGIAWGLDQAFAEEPRLAVTDRSNPASGLVRVDFYDWNKVLPDLLNEEKPDLVVIAVGVNDRQQMREAGKRIAVRSEAWEKTYVQRVTGMADTLKVYGRPFFWVGVPPVRSTASANDMVYINGLVKSRVDGPTGHFVDIWNGFADENGRYVSSGPDVDGQPRQLRTGDGINFTRAGKRKLAFYVEREIRKQPGFGSGAVDLLASVTQSNQIEIAPDGTKRLVGPIISLTDPLPGASEMLAGGSELSVPAGESLQYRMIVKGESLPAVAGRVDDFSWPPGQRDTSFLGNPVSGPPATAALPEGAQPAAN
jgi:hypothetical protein